MQRRRGRHSSMQPTRHQLRRVHRGCLVAISLLSGCGGASARSDVYIAGYVDNGTGPTATLWANGNPVALTADTQRSLATAVTVSESGDVYVAGGVAGASADMAVYWKNGAVVTLTDGTRQSFAEAIAVSEGHVYVAGYETDEGTGPVAKFWKNGVATALTKGTSNADA